jgi:uncharacterized ferritin-like protein (DUF455 family)
MDFHPFITCPAGGRPAKPRSLSTREGLGDRMRTAAFAEFQAIAAFRWAAGHFQDVPQALRNEWAAQVGDEERHYRMICDRMEDLGLDLAERPVSTALWESLQECASGREFCLKIAAAEERGRRAAVQLVTQLGTSDPETAAVFREIATDEIRHVALAETYFGWIPD